MKVSRTGQWGMLFCSLLMVSACSAKRPVFYPNDHLQTVGKTQARADADQCMAEAKEYGVKNDAGKTVGGRAVKGATLGAAISAVVSAVLGGNVGRAAGAGAAGGATAGAVSGAIDADEPDAVFRNYVNRCLRERGYEVIGWQ
ncbi:cell envelope biogenesis protein OmpA [uncultured Desulfosarcina sp.]|uniref:cell envelope biogenesis protein OmpA n=1 Tax=uncultured Desulfosarcina sp. TaxID=218289 RepID=UPI0029C83D10|nr:cell envelope biogenesis protein OmpA [uncultured Desulfosarcina sp.]